MKLLIGFLLVTLASVAYYGIRASNGLYGFSVGDCLSISGAYKYKVTLLGKYSIKAVKAIEYSDHNVYEFAVLDRKDLRQSYLVDCFETFDTYNKQGEKK